MSIDFSHFKHSDRNETFFFFEEQHIEKYNINIVELLPKTRFFKELSDRFSVSYYELYDIVFNKLHLNVRNFFQFSLNGLILIKKKALYKEKWEKGECVKTFYDVYLSANEYSSLHYDNVATYILEEAYPTIFKNSLFKNHVRKYPNNIDIKPYYTIGDVSHNHEYDKLTMEDIVKLITNPNEVNALKEESKFSLYSGIDFFFLKLGSIEVQGIKYDYSLYIPYNAIFNKDWSEIEKQFVTNIIKPNANEKLGKDSNNWFNGKQKDAPYWNMYYEQYIKPLKELFDSL